VASQAVLTNTKLSRVHTFRLPGDGKYASEDVIVAELLRTNTLSDADLSRIEDDAVAIVEALRAHPEMLTTLDGFLQEYGLSNKEGVALMRLAEAMLRIPDAETRALLIADKIAPGDWGAHIGKSGTRLVNASTWALLLTGRVTGYEDEKDSSFFAFLGKITNRLGEPVIRKAVGQAMKIMGGEFVLGENIPDARKRGDKLFGKGQIYSFDMLGEGARTMADAQRHFASYQDAICQVGAMPGAGSVIDRSGVSVKLSAIYPRYEFSNAEAAVEEISAKLLQLVQQAAAANVKLTVDAEEADRLEMSLDIFERVARAATLGDYQGFGLAIQAYGKRARSVIARVATLGRELGVRFMVRLVKGAYWDAEIKHAQELGLPNFTVFTRKSTTDLSYLVCAQDMLSHRDVLFCQFATHNAHTISAIMHIGKNMLGTFEFQRLHGMGQAVYTIAREQFASFPAVRIYAPVGGHKDLLAYLVRRLLENGANSSFVNRFMDAELPARQVVQDPVSITRTLESIAHPHISTPQALFGASRPNSTGLDLSAADDVAALERAIDTVYADHYTVSSLLGSVQSGSAKQEMVTNPANSNDILGHAIEADLADIDPAIHAAHLAQRQWDQRGGLDRASILKLAADVMNERLTPLSALLMREAGKTRDDAVAEVREGVDFLRYYADQAAREFSGPQILPGPAGEANTLSLQGRGVFVCISPWNFPLAIFVGQIAAALASGNTVLAKPAPQTPIIAYDAVRILHEAGVPKDVLMLVIGDAETGAALVEHPLVAGVAFTGSTATAKRINSVLAGKPGPIVPLIAETGGQNVMFVDSTALLEQVTDDVIKSSFHSAGQRCSALRVLYLQADIADAAIAMIKGAMALLKTGDPREIDTDVGPVIDDTAANALRLHIEDMEAHGHPLYAAPLPSATAPGLFVLPTLFEISSMSELDRENFGPVLHVIRYQADKLNEALADAFSSGFGLTLGIHTRMDRRWQQIARDAPVGNIYVNRNMVGAVVGSQPFGGQGLSGTGFKAGGPRYLYRFATEKTLSVNTAASGGNVELLALG
jgi:RHH-type transcriptional regulator, proline utilization regulon repressor / proline dehydrogenase / delta 1-pyrroline-5-carboxylate dehydrogenase